MDFFRILQGGTGVGMSNFDRLWSQKFNDNWPIITLSGSLPLTFESKGDALTNYRVYGSTSGVGDETGNLIEYLDVTRSLYGVTIKADSNGISVNGKATSSGGRAQQLTKTLTLPAGTYTYSVYYIGDRKRAMVWLQNAQTIATISAGGTITLNEETNVFVGVNVMEDDEYDFEIKVSVTPGSTAPASYTPPGYQIPILLHDNKTDNNVFDPSAHDVNKGFMTDLYLKGDGTTGASTSWNISEYIDVISGATYDIQWNYSTSTAPAYVFYDKNKNYISGAAYGNSRHAIVSAPTNARYLRISIYKTIVNQLQIMAPNTSNYNLYIGDSKLYEEEFLDYQEQKIYKDVSGTLTPADPPVPFPSVQTFSGENTLDSSETIEQAEITGKIKAKENENESP